MNRTSLLIIVCLFVAVVCVSCKKGEDSNVITFKNTLSEKPYWEVLELKVVPQRAQPIANLDGVQFYQNNSGVFNVVLYNNGTPYQSIMDPSIRHLGGGKFYISNGLDEVYISGMYLNIYEYRKEKGIEYQYHYVLQEGQP